MKSVMELIASEPLDSHLYFIERFDQLADIVHTLINVSCGTKPLSTVTTTTTTPTTTTTVATTTPIPTTTTTLCEFTTTALVRVLLVTNSSSSSSSSSSRSCHLSALGHWARLTQAAPAHNAASYTVKSRSPGIQLFSWSGLQTSTCARWTDELATTLDCGDRPFSATMEEQFGGPSWLQDDDDNE